MVRLKNLYQGILGSPYNEQGILAKDCLMSSIRVSDRALKEGKIMEAKMAFKTGELLKNMVLGELYIDKPPRFVYEYCVGKDLLTGEEIKVPLDEQITRLSFLLKEALSLESIEKEKLKNILRAIRDETLKKAFSPLPFEEGPPKPLDADKPFEPKLKGETP